MEKGVTQLLAFINNALNSKMINCTKMERINPALSRNKKCNPKFLIRSKAY